MSYHSVFQCGAILSWLHYYFGRHESRPWSNYRGLELCRSIPKSHMFVPCSVGDGGSHTFIARPSCAADRGANFDRSTSAPTPVGRQQIERIKAVLNMQSNVQRNGIVLFWRMRHTKCVLCRWTSVSVVRKEGRREKRMLMIQGCRLVKLFVFLMI
jgi:hypothetical protein